MITSHRHIVRSSAIIGSASGFNVLLSLARMKMAALLIGVAGVGLLGLCQSFVATAAALCGLGVGASATRSIAKADKEDAVVRPALLWLTILLAFAGTGLTWLFRGLIASELLGDPSLSTAVGWLSLGVGLTVVGASFTALLTGLRHVGDLARVAVLSGVITTVAALGAFLWLDVPTAAVTVVLISTGTAALVAYWYARKVPRPRAPRPSFSVIAREWRTIVGLGVALMAGGLISNGGPLAVRTFIGDRLGLAELGHFQASWAVASTYLGLVLQAMGTDYFPRLSAASGDVARNRLINEQIEVALLLGSPIILLGIGAAPLLIAILYSSEFAPAAAVLRWQMLGDVLKIASWPIGFLLMASGRGGRYVLMEALAMGIFVASTMLLLGRLGIAGAGVAYLLMYIVYFGAILAVARRLTHFRIAPVARNDLLAVSAAALFVFVIALLAPRIGVAAAFAMSIAFALRSYLRLRAVVARSDRGAEPPS